LDIISLTRKTKNEVCIKEVFLMTKKVNKGSKNQNSPKTQHQMAEFSQELMTSGDNSKGNKRNKDQNDKTDRD